MLQRQRLRGGKVAAHRHLDRRMPFGKGGKGAGQDGFGVFVGNTNAHRPIQRLFPQRHGGLIQQAGHAAGIGHQLLAPWRQGHATRLAQEQGLASLSRDVFLDDVRTPEAIAGQLRIAVELARRQGSAVLIGHPYPQTLEVLERELPRLKAQGIEWVEIHQMIALRSNQAMAAHGAGGRYRASAGGQ